MKRRLLSLLLVFVMVLGMFPVSAMANGNSGSVRVIVENTKLSIDQGAAWYGTLADMQVPLSETSTMMSCVVYALEAAGAECTGAENGYIGSINGLGEFAGGYPGAGWMGTLNDWFVDSGFNDVTVAEDELVDGDEIRVMFTLDMGSDLGGGWENQDGYLSAMTVSEGELSPAFDKETQKYTLTLEDTVANVDITAKAENKQEKVLVSVGDNVYHRGENVNVTDGAAVTISCGSRTYEITMSVKTHEHNYGGWIETTAPGCTTPGEETRTCGCGYSETRPVAELGHNFETGSCTRCGEADPDYAEPVSTVIYSGTDWPYSRYYVASLTLVGPAVDYVDGTDVYLNCKTAKDASFTLNTVAGGSSSGNLGIKWNDGDTNTKTFTGNLVDGEATVKIYAYKASGAGVSRNGTKTFQLHVAEPNELPVLAEGQAAAESITKTAGEPFEADLSKVFYDADGDVLTYYVSVNGGAASETSANYSYTNRIAGTYTLVFTVTDNKGTSNASYTVTLNLGNSSETKTVIVQLPEALEAKFYVTNGFENNTDVLGAELTATPGTTADGMTAYAIAYPINAEYISVRTEAWGGMAVAVSENGSVAMRPVSVKTVDFTDTDTEATVTVTYDGKKAAAGSSGWLLAAGSDYSFSAAPKDTSTYATKTETLTVEPGSETIEITLNLPYKSPKTITAPNGAEVKLFDYVKYYDFTELEAKAIVDNGDGTKTYYYTTSQSDLSWRATMDGKITEAGHMPWKGNVTVTFDNGAGSSNKNASLTDESVLVNVNGQNHLKLAEGDSYKLKAYRVWEIIKLSYQNEMLTPDFNWEILSGNDVISLTPAQSRSSGGNGADSDWMTVTALQNGTAVIEVSYDALDVSTDGSWPGLYAASDPSRTGLIVVTVGGEDNSVNFGIDCFASQGSVLYSKSTPKAWDAEFDTLYFTGKAGLLKFAPTAASTITNVAVSNDKGSSWTTLTAADGIYTANIVPGNNILRVTTDAGAAYQIVRGDKVNVTFTEQEGDNDGLYEAGETVRVTVSGLHTPIPKMSGNYNPGYQGNTDGKSAVHMTYTVNGESQEGAGAQYTFATEANYIDVTIPADYTEKTFTLTDGYIGVGVIGLTAFADGGDSHRNIPDGGCATRGSTTTFHTRSILPEVVIPVGEISVEVESVTLNKTELELVEEEHETLTATVLPENATDKTVTWSSSDEAVATVADGVVTAVKAGTATITATAGDKSASCIVTVTEPKQLATLDEMYEATAETLLDYEVGTGSIGGEWLMFGLARALDKEPTDQQKQDYLNAVSNYIKNTITDDGKLHSFKSTENARIALALTALGEDPADFAGYDLLKAYADTTWAKQQGNNGASFALLTLNAAEYETSNRQALIDSLLDNQNEDGGWPITTGSSDMDATSMAVQALAPYYADAEVKAAVDAALILLANKMNDKGQIDIGSSSIKPSPEVNAQVIVALAELGRNPATDKQFTKNGKTLIDGLATFFVETGFAHAEGSTYNQMATEQAFYAMVACKRVAAGENSLYDMTVDRTVRYTITIAASENGTVSASAEQAAAGTEITLTAEPDIGYELDALTVEDASGNTIAVTNNSFIMPAANVTVTAEFAETENPVQDVIDAIEALNVTKADQATQQKIAQIQDAYDTLSAENKAKVANYSDLETAIAGFNRLLNTAKGEAVEELEDLFGALKEENYTRENWEKIQTLRNKALADVEKAENTDEISAIVKQAKDDLEDIATGEEITVTFRLIGDGQHDNGVTDHEAYVTWIPTTTYTMEPGATMYDVFMMAISDHGLSQTGASSNYVSSIKAPSCLGGFWLGEFDNGPNSGWMYTVNGTHPGTGLKTYSLKDGDRIVWHYVDDYVLEERTSSSQYYYRWLEAKDISPEAYVKEKVGEILTVGGHGTVEPSAIKLSDIGKDITFTFKPDTGYVVRDVIVDGESKGSITTYTYKNLRYDSRIEVKFAKAGELFDDVKESNWFYDDVMFVVEEGLFNGTGDNKFSPNASMNRAMLVTVLYRLEGEPKVTGSSAFQDVARGQWYTNAVIWATENEIVNGYGNGKFGPTDNITREQMTTILFRYAQFKKYDTSASNALTGYRDFSSISVFSLKAMKWANAEGLINGRTATTLSPKGTATRAEVAAILHRFVEKVVNN